MPPWGPFFIAFEVASPGSSSQFQPGLDLNFALLEAGHQTLHRGSRQLLCNFATYSHPRRNAGATRKIARRKRR